MPPWEKYQSAPVQADGPWSKFKNEASQPQQPKTVSDLWNNPPQDGLSLIGMARGVYDAAKSAVTLPGDVAAGRVDPTSDEAISRSMELATLATPASRALKVAAPSPIKAPARDAIRAASRDGYETAKNMGVEIRPEAAHSLSQEIGQTLGQAGYRDYLAPKTFRATQELQSPLSPQSATIADFEGVRRALGKAGADPAEKDAAGRAKNIIDDYLSNIPEEDALAGDTAGVSKVLNDARANYAAAKRSDRVGSAIENAENNAKSANSGNNIDNSTRAQFKSIIKNPKLARGFNAEELSQMRKIVRGGIVGNSLRSTGKLLGGGGGIGALATAGIGGMAMGPQGVALPAAGRAAMKLADALTKRQVSNLDNMVRARSPLAEQMAKQIAKKTPVKNEKSEMLAELLLRGQLAAQPN